MSRPRLPAGLPRFKRSPCLGCSASVSEHRDGYVSIAGKRDGSWLAVYEVSPYLMLATDVETIPSGPLYLLGVAHRACVERAMHRLLAREVHIPEGLPLIYMDEPPDPFENLDQVPAKTNCPFCGASEDLTDEHIFPQWVSNVFPNATFQSSKTGRNVARLDLTTRICRSCNNEWLSVLEKDASGILTPMLRGDDRVSLSQGEQTTIAFWAVKIALMIDSGSESPIIPIGFYRELRLIRAPLPASHVLLGAYMGDKAALALASPMHIGVGPGPKPERPNAVVYTIALLRCAFQVFLHFTAGNARVVDTRSELLAGLHPIWPSPDQPIVWPKNGFAFGNDSFQLLAETVDRGNSGG